MYTTSAFHLILQLFFSFSQFSLLSEIRAFIFPRDIDRFDGLVLKREVEAMKVSFILFYIN